MLLVNLTVVLVANAGLRGQFVDEDNPQSMASQVPVLKLLAVGVMLTMASGNGSIDLSSALPFSGDPLSIDCNVNCCAPQ